MGLAPRWKRAIAGLATGLALGAVFLAYLQPDLVMTLANQLWSCF